MLELMQLDKVELSKQLNLDVTVKENNELLKYLTLELTVILPNAPLGFCEALAKKQVDAIILSHTSKIRDLPAIIIDDDLTMISTDLGLKHE